MCIGDHSVESAPEEVLGPRVLSNAGSLFATTLKASRDQTPQVFHTQVLSLPGSPQMSNLILPLGSASAHTSAGIVPLRSVLLKLSSSRAVRAPSSLGTVPLTSTISVISNAFNFVSSPSSDGMVPSIMEWVIFNLTKFESRPTSVGIDSSISSWLRMSFRSRCRFKIVVGMLPLTPDFLRCTNVRLVATESTSGKGVGSTPYNSISKCVSPVSATNVEGIAPVIPSKSARRRYSNPTRFPSSVGNVPVK